MDSPPPPFFRVRSWCPESPGTLIVFFHPIPLSFPLASYGLMVFSVFSVLVKEAYTQKTRQDSYLAHESVRGERADCLLPRFGV